MGMNGTRVLVGVNTGTALAPVYTVLGSQRNLDSDESNDVIDLSSKDARQRKVDYGRYSSSLALDALYLPSDSAYNLLRTRQRNGEMVTVRKELDGTGWEEAECLISNMSDSFPDQDAATISMSLEVNGSWSPV